VLWVSAGRGPATRGRAQAADLTDAGSLSALVAGSDVVLSVCPPHAAPQVAHAVAATGFTGLYVDANAVAPSTARAIGAAAGEVAALFAATDLEAVNLGEDVTAASALKMCYAAWTKGTSALLLAIRAAAVVYGVDEALLGEWERTQPGLAARSRTAAGTARKGRGGSRVRWTRSRWPSPRPACPMASPAPPPSCTAGLLPPRS